jgi:hypothetical protein
MTNAMSDGLNSWFVSGTFWAIAGVGVAIVLGAVSVWSQFRSSNPRRRLDWRWSAVALLHTEANASLDIEVRHAGERLDNPYLVTLEVVNRGRRSVRSEDFDGGRPIEFALGARPLEILKRNRRLSPNPIALSYGGAEQTTLSLSIGPDVIERDDTVTVSVLVDAAQGIVPRVQCIAYYLPDIPLRERPWDVAELASEAKWRVVSSAAGYGGVIAATLALLSTCS